MKSKRAAPVALAVAAFYFAACSDLTTPASLSDAIINADIAANAGDAIAQAVADMAANESQSGLAAITSGNTMSATAEPTYTRSRTCYNASDAVVTNCTPISQVRRIVTHVTADGTREGSRSTEGGPVTTWTATVHIVADDTLRRVFSTAQPPVETSRRHSALITGRDTVVFTQGEFTRSVAARSDDTVKAVTWNLPRSQNPFPVSGSIVRAVNWRVEASGPDQSFTRDVARLIEVDFPADAQGNVVLKINDLTCNLNLVTRIVTSCQ